MLQILGRHTCYISCYGYNNIVKSPVLLLDLKEALGDYHMLNRKQ